MIKQRLKIVIAAAADGQVLIASFDLCCAWFFFVFLAEVSVANDDC